MPSIADWISWQLADSAFPSGGFAHSNGIEVLWKQGEIADSGQLVDLLSEALHQLRHTDLPIIASVIRAPGLLEVADRQADAMNLNAVSNNASRLQGRALLTAAEQAFDSHDLTDMADALRQADSPRHLPAAFAAVSLGLGLEPERALSLYLFAALRSMLSAAVRLGIVGPLEAQSIHFKLATEGERLAADAVDCSLDDAHQPSPLLDLLQANHNRLYSRLFQS